MLEASPKRWLVPANLHGAKTQKNINIIFVSMSKLFDKLLVKVELEEGYVR
jgi:hypothetical protein